MIATDPDSAGWQAAQRAFWRLAALRAAPRHLTLPERVDPTDALSARQGGAQPTIVESGDFTRALIERLLDERLATQEDAFSRVDHCREVARITGALPPGHWLEHAQRVSELLDLPLAMVNDDILEDGARWTDEPTACTARELARLKASAAPMVMRRERSVEQHYGP